MAEILTIDQAKAAAQKVAEMPAQVEQEQKNLFQSIMEQMSTVNQSLGGFEELGALLALPDEMFTILGPIFLEELEKGLNNTNDKMLLIQALNASGMQVQDVQAEYVSIAAGIDKMEGLTNMKKDFLKQMIGMVYNGIADTAGAGKKFINISVELCHPDAKMPTYANPGDSGMDVYAVEDTTIAPGETKLIHTGIKMAIPLGYEIQVRPKSGRALKTKLRVANTPGTIDSGYRDEICVIIDNIEPPVTDVAGDYIGDGSSGPITFKVGSVATGREFTIGKGEKFCQFVLCEVPKAVLHQVESVGSIANDGRNGGFGSTSLY